MFKPGDRVVRAQKHRGCICDLRFGLKLDDYPEHLGGKVCPKGRSCQGVFIIQSVDTRQACASGTMVIVKKDHDTWRVDAGYFEKKD